MYEPLGSSTTWKDTECYPLHGYLSCHLYRASAGNGAFAYSREGQSTTPPILDGVSENVSNHWKWGFSVGAGTQLFHYDWDVCAEYQYFAGSERQDVSQTGSQTLIPLKSVTLDGARVDVARGRTALMLNQLDIDLTKRFHFQENVLVNTGVGVRSTWVKNNEATLYTGGPTLTTNVVNVTQNNKYWGIGPLATLSGRFLFSEIFYLVAKTGVSLEYTLNRSTYGESRTNDSTATINFYEKKQYLAPTLDMKIGFGVAKYVMCDDAHVSLDFTYDTQILWKRANSFEVQPFSSPRYTRPFNDVTLQGFALSLSVLY